MTPEPFEHMNSEFVAPPGYADTQVAPTPAYVGHVQCCQSSVDGAKIVVTAWKPSPAELQELIERGSVFVTCLGGLPAMMLTTNFEAATHPK